MIRIYGGSFEKFTYPVGEMQVCLKSLPTGNVDILFDFESNEEIVELMLLVNAIEENGGTIGDLYLDYIPFCRQDRIVKWGDTFSLKVFADVINNLKFKNVITKDPHSYVSTALFNHLVVRDVKFLSAEVRLGIGSHYLISPDVGASKKTRTCITSNTIDVIYCHKERDIHTGDIIETKIFYDDFKGVDCLIIDDICDGGRTFTEIAKVLKRKNAGKIILYVTHGFFTKGLEVFDGLIDEIYTHKGKVK